MKSIAVGSTQFVNKSLKLEPGKWYSVAWKSTNTGHYGGGLLLESRNASNSKTTIFNESDVLNGFHVFQCPQDSDRIEVYAYSGKNNSKIGDTATFEIIVAEGTEYIPPMHNLQDVVGLLSVINNRTALNLFEYSDISGVRASVSVDGETITVKTTDISNFSYCRKNIYLKENTNYTICAKSIRTGQTGGGIRIFAIKNDISEEISNNGNSLNPNITFNTGSGYDYYTIAFVSGMTNEQSVGDTATFSDVMLVEGDFAPNEYVPYIGYKNFSEAIAAALSK